MSQAMDTLAADYQWAPSGTSADDARGRQARLDVAFRSAADPRRYLLLFRFITVNMVGVALLAAAYVQGWVQAVLVADQTYISTVIFGVFLVGMTMAGRRVWRVSAELNHARGPQPPDGSRTAVYLDAVAGAGADSRAITASALRLKLLSRITAIRNIANSLVLLGLIGTVIGFIIALSGVNPQAAGDAATIAPMVSTLIKGMSVALYTTLVGSLLNVWLMINFNVLSSGMVTLITTIVERGERDARS